jgi:hypothetical protein
MASGSQYTVFDIPQGAKVGILICYDNNIIENVRMTALKGAEILLAPHQTGGCDSPSPRCMGRIDPNLWKTREDNPEPLKQSFEGPKEGSGLCIGFHHGHTTMACSFFSAMASV